MECVLCLQALKCNAVIFPPEQASQRQHNASSGGTLRALLCNCRRNRSTLPFRLTQKLDIGVSCVLHIAAKTAAQSHSCAPQLSLQTLQSLEVSSSLHVAQLIPVYLASANHSDSWLQAELDAGHSIAALRRFSDNLAKLPEHGWGMPPDHHL